MTKELVDEDLSFAQVSGDQERATGGEDAPQFDERPAKFMSSHMLDRVVGRGARERSQCEGECSHVPADGSQTRMRTSQPDHLNSQVGADDLDPLFGQISAHLPRTAADIEHSAATPDFSHESIERSEVNGQLTEVVAEDLGILMRHRAIGSTNNSRTERLHRESFP